MKTTAGSPFHPTFGSTPPELAGRDRVIDVVGGALDDGPGAAARGSLITGARGIGKTVTLNAIEDDAAERGWVVLSESVTAGLTERLLRERIPEATAALGSIERRRRVTGVTLPAGLGGVMLAPPGGDRPLGLRDGLDRLIGLATDHGGSGVLITLDEVHGRQGRRELIDLADQVQHLIRRRRDIALIAAGLPAAVQDLLNEDVTTFLRRATRFSLDPLTPPEAEDALRLPIEQAGRRIDPDALAAAVHASQGYPYLVQIIGDYAWKRTPPEDAISLEQVDWAVRRAVHDLGVQVHGTALHDLSPKDREFLLAMSIDDGPSNISSVAARLGKPLSYTSRYRARLLAAEIVRPVGHGLLDFALPYLRDHLRGLPGAY